MKNLSKDVFLFDDSPIHARMAKAYLFFKQLNFKGLQQHIK